MLHQQSPAGTPLHQLSRLDSLGLVCYHHGRNAGADCSVVRFFLWQPSAGRRENRKVPVDRPHTDKPSETAALGMVLLAWLIPGAGHYCLGQRVKALFFCATVVGMLMLGLVFSDYTVISAKNHMIALCVQVFAGLPTLLAVKLLGDPSLKAASPYVDLGMAMTLIAAALNILLVADVLHRASLEEGDAA